MGRALWAIIERELRRMLRQRGRLVSGLVRPLIWLLIIGSGFETMLGSFGPGGYRQFLVPGLLGMTVLFGGMLASLSTAYDLESGVMRMLIMAPFAHFWIVVARTVSAVVVAVVQALLLLIILTLFGLMSGGISISLLALGLIATAFACSSMGMLIAVWAKSLENFAVIMNFVIFPVFFLSGALYPVHHLPAVLKAAAAINPFTYGVDLLKHAMDTHSPTVFGTDFNIWFDVTVLIGFTLLTLTIACLRFSQASVFEGIARILSAPRRR